MKSGLIVVVTVATVMSFAQQGAPGTKQGKRFSGDIYGGLGREMDDAFKVWNELNDAFDARFRSFLASPPPGRSPLCESSCKEDLEQLRRAHEVFVKKKIIFYEQHLSDASQGIEVTKRSMAAQRLRITNIGRAFETEKKELDSLLEQMPVLNNAPAAGGGGGERAAEARKRLEKAIAQQQEIVSDLQETKDKAEKVLETLQRGIELHTDLREDNRRYVTSINANNEFWQSHYDLRLAQFDLICPSPPIPAPVNPRPKK